MAGSERKEINVTMTVERLEDEVYLIELDSDCFVGGSDEYVYRADPNRVSVRVRALREELDSLRLDADDVLIDVSDLTEGVHVIPVRFIAELDPAYEVVTVGTCSLNVTKMPDGPGATASADEERTTEAE